MKDPLSYTYDGIERELNLLEIHLKEAPKGDEAFCKDCIEKHISTIRGYALEGPGFTDDLKEQEKFLNTEKQIKEIKGKDYKKHGVEYAHKVRQIRKSLTDECPNCKTLSESEKRNLSKSLNTSDSFDILANENHTHNSEAELNSNQDKMKANLKELGLMNAGQFAAEGIRYAVDTYKPEWDKYVTIGGGIGLQVLPMFVKLPKVFKDIAVVAGSNLLAGGVVKLIKGAGNGGTVVTARAAMNNNNNIGKPHTYAPTFGGPTFRGKVTAKNIPTEYTRAGILSGAQSFSDPSHAGLIRVD